MLECSFFGSIGACHWVEEYPCRYCHSFSRFNLPASIVVEWLAKKCKVASQRAPTSTIVEGNIHKHDKGKRKVNGNREAEKSCKFKADPLVLKKLWTLRLRGDNTTRGVYKV